jgi:hypothetical protein
MRHIRTIRWGLLGMVVALVAAAPQSGVDDLIREANAAVAGKDFAAAVALYRKAEERALDPGLVAYNKGVALYQQAVAAEASSEKEQSFRQAELAFRCGTEGAEGTRLLHARLGLAGSLVQGRTQELAAIREAVGLYRACLQSDRLEAAAAEDVRHNLEIAKFQLWRLQARPNKPEKPKNNGEGDKPPPPDPKKPDPKDPMGGDPMQGNRKPTPTENPGEVKKDGKDPQPTEKTVGGVGNLKTIYDPTQVPPLTAGEADSALDEAFKAIRDRQRNRLRATRFPAGTVKDW